jgi:hypothetical protein
MQLRGAGRLAAKVGAACVLAGGALALSATGVQAAPAAVANHPISGISAAISCMTASRCVVVGYGASGAHGHGDVIALTKGKQGHISAVASSERLDSVSCPSSAGCWALGPQNGGTNLVLVRIGPTGNVVKALKVSEPSGASIGAISCSSMTSCAVLGNIFAGSTLQIEIGTWAGLKLVVHTVKGPRGVTDTIPEGISCWKTSCLAVGYYDLAIPNSTGFLLTMHNGTTGAVHTVSNRFFYGVSCVTLSRCYAAGFFAHAAGFVVTVNHGVVTHTQAESADVTGIECAGGNCHASGRELGGSSYWGVIVPLSNGTNAGPPLVDKSVAGFFGASTIATRGNGFAAVGPAPKSGSEVATG